jgi:hypothetical protein
VRAYILLEQHHESIFTGATLIGVSEE